MKLLAMLAVCPTASWRPRHPALPSIDGDWVWCLCCERAYPAGWARFGEDGSACCPYPDCQGDALWHAWSWESARREPEPERNLPVEPALGVRYPLYEEETTQAAGKIIPFRVAPPWVPWADAGA
jgi:hypothetical protein